MSAAAIPIADIRAARERIAGAVLRTPLVRLANDDAPAEIWLKLENLQPIGSFKLRGASNAMATASPEALARGVWTASAGNMALGVAWQARRLGIPCAVVVPEHAAGTKIAAAERLGARVIRVPAAQWFEIFETRRSPGLDGTFIHAFDDAAVMAGNGTIGLEIVEDLPDVDAVVVPYGGGGLACGIASALRALRPAAKVYASEVETAPALAAAFAAGAPAKVIYTPSFVDGIGSPSVFATMWPRVQALLAGSLVVTLEQIAAAIRLLAERHRVIAEGAGGSSVAAALAGKAGRGKVVCIVSGGNLDAARLVKILQGELPS